MARSPARKVLRALSALLVASFLICVLTSASCGRKRGRPPSEYPLVASLGASESVLRVLLFETTTPVLVSARRGATASPLDGAQQPVAWPAMHEVGVSPITSGILIGDRRFRSRQVRLKPDGGSYLVIDGRTYRGTLLLAKRDGGELLGINEIGVEAYLPSTVGAEMPSRWPLEALKAQAIAARSYALYRAYRRRGDLFCLRATARDQMYRGIVSETGRSDRAVAATRGIVVSWQRRLFPAFYSSTCGGATEPADRALRWPPIPPLCGVTCGFCNDSKFYRWQRKADLAEAQEAVARLGFDLGDVQSIRPIPVEQRTYRAVSVLRTNGSSATLPADTFRRALGGSVIRSLVFEARREGQELVFTGRGWGHLAGMCQWGARGMARKGHSADDILKHYYPGAELVRAY